MRGGVRGCNGRAVRSTGFQREVAIVRTNRRDRGRRRAGHRAVAVKGLERAQVYPIDVSAERHAPLGEGQRHPGFEMLDEFWRHLGILGEVVVQTVGERVHQRFQPRRARLVLRLQGIRVDEDLHAQVLPHPGLTLDLRQSPDGVNVIHLHAIEVVLGLCVHHAEDRIGIRLAVHVRNAPVVTNDRDILGLFLPAREILVVGALRRLQGEYD